MRGIVVKLAAATWLNQLWHNKRVNDKFIGSRLRSFMNRAQFEDFWHRHSWLVTLLVLTIVAASAAEISAGVVSGRFETAVVDAVKDKPIGDVSSVWTDKSL